MAFCLVFLSRASMDLLYQQGRRELCTELKMLGINKHEEISLSKKIRLKDCNFFSHMAFFPLLAFVFKEPYLLEKARRNPRMPPLFPSAHHSKDLLTGIDETSLSFLGNCLYKIEMFRECLALLSGYPVFSPITGRIILRGN